MKKFSSKDFCDEYFDVWNYEFSKIYSLFLQYTYDDYKNIPDEKDGYSKGLIVWSHVRNYFTKKEWRKRFRQNKDKIKKFPIKFREWSDIFEIVINFDENV